MEADKLFAKAYKKYKAALSIKDHMHEALSNWGNTLLNQAKTKDGLEADELFAQARKKCQAALEIKRDDYVALDNWGLSLTEQAKTKDKMEADQLYAQAKEKFQAANALVPGLSSYDLACIAALQGKEDDCLKWLKDSQAHGKLQSLQHIDEDKDFDSVRDKEWFKEFRASLS
jgi:tetratricopeptide (TPR) repeat protein